ncbi:homoserine dehydrogenase [Stomatohabitans albus]|uniref:homoserine dehydrogenase n=1 Tax=Stomatohabitans albus TaxID=3110766 RepID=UPI00300D040B
MSGHKALTIGLLGAGTVGTGVLKLLQAHADQIERRVGAPVRVGPVMVRDISRNRGIDAQWTTNPKDIIANPAVDIVVEVMGGVEPARTWLLEALNAGQSVVTANKELLAKHGRELYAAAAANHVRLEYEAAVAGAIPIIRPMRDSLSGDRITKVMGILNGTTNFILTKMAEDGADFGTVLAEAQALGYAEADPSADVDGFDAAAKTAILASIAFDAVITLEDVEVTGITAITADQIALASKMGYVIKLLGFAIREQLATGEETISVGVSPAWVGHTNPLAGVRGANNAVLIEADGAGQLMFYGPGAGSLPTGSAVMGDVVTAARGRLAGERAGSVATTEGIKPVPGAGQSEWAVLLEVEDRAGVLAEITSVLGRNQVSMKSVWQEGHASGIEGEGVSLLIVTHEADSQLVKTTVEELLGLPGVQTLISLTPVID